MKYIHVRNLEKYQDGYKDRKHYWSKIYLEMIQGNAQSEMLCEVDFARLVKMIVLESCTQKMTLLSEAYLVRKGFDFGLRSLESTLKELSHFIEIVDVTESHEISTEVLPREEKRREEKKREEYKGDFDLFWQAYPKKRSKNQAIKAWKALKPDEHLHDRILGALEKAKDSVEWANERGKYIPYPATWLNAGGWEDELTPKVVDSMNLNKTQTKNMEALGDFLKRKGAVGPEDLRTGNGDALRCLPGG